MKPMKKILYILIGILLGGSSIAYAAPIVFPALGGTGTSNIPTLGQVLVGQSNGTYAPQATSTLGISGGSGSNYWAFNGNNLYPATSTSYITADHFVSTSTNKNVFPVASTTSLYINGITSSFLATNGSGLVISTTTPIPGTSIPGGLNQQIQFDSNGVFGGMGNFYNSNGNPNISTGGELDYNGYPVLTAIPTSGDYLFGNAMYMNYSTLGTYNVGVGQGAIGQNSSGSFNVAVGTAAAGNLTSGSNNTAVGGEYTLDNLHSGSNNVGIGNYSLWDIFTGSGNVGIGYDAGKSSDDASNALYIDNQDRGSIAGEKTGSLLYGTFNATPSSQTLTINASTTVAQNLTVNGTNSAQTYTAVSTTATSTFPIASTTNLYLPITSSFLATNASGKVIATTSPSGGGSGTVTSVGLSLPTGLTVTNSPVTTSGTLTATIANPYSLRELPSWTVGAAGADYTTIQAALNACGTAGGGNIYLTDSTYALGGTGLTWKGGYCSLWGRGLGTTTITFTGATTAIKTNSPSSDYESDEIHNIEFSGDANTSGVAVDWSDMSHGIVDGVQMLNVGTAIKLADTQNVTFYNSFSNIEASSSAYGILASSSNPENGNYFTNMFLGSDHTNVVGIVINNGNGNVFNNISIEPGLTTGTVGLKIFDYSGSGGVFDNSFSNFYIEANGIGVSMANALDSSGGIERNSISNFMNESNATADWSLGTQSVADNTFINNMDSNYSNPLTSFEGPVGIGTSTELMNINNAPVSPLLNIGPESGSGTSTIAFGKLQFDAYNSAGTRVCVSIVGTAFNIVTGACAHE